MTRAFLLAPLAALLLGSAATPGPKGAPKGPALWHVTDKDTTIYLFGTIHMLPKGSHWRSRRINSALQRSGNLVLEVGNLNDKEALRTALLKYALLPTPIPITERITPSRKASLAQLIARTGQDQATFDSLEDWAVAILLSNVVLSTLDVSGDEGPEAKLRGEFVRSKRPITGLETAEGQFAIFDSLSGSAQQALLNTVLDENESAADEFKAMYGAWIRGDQRAISLTFDDAMRSMPDLEEKLSRRRNANWTQWIANRMGQPGTVFLAVGAGHLAGSNSVLKMLQQRGLKVSRIQ